ncbi:MAG: maleate cis-trans isomerase family protein [Rhodobacterales bacterium]|jgi:maleate isomerase|tara:strand:+ start:639 stop:1373 length:735 start_codon:yes stop_codon:yes gene_type:complete
MSFDFTTNPAVPAMGLIVLQSDETIEQDFRRIFGAGPLIYVTRVPTATQVTRDTLQQMAETLPAAASLFAEPTEFSVVGYGCTSGTAQIGADNIARLVREGCTTPEVTQPVSGLLAACATLNIKRLGFLSPYVEDVSAHLVNVLEANGVACPVFGSFDEACETVVAHISSQSTYDAAVTLAAKGGIDALFLSCTNLRTLDIIEKLEAETGLPVLSSNQVLAWHMAQLSGKDLTDLPFGTLFKQG